MLCPIHKTKMTELLTSWVCDTCHPPAGEDSVATLQNFALKLNQAQLDQAQKSFVPGKAVYHATCKTMFPTSHAPGPAPTVQCSDGYTWKLWTHDTSTFRIPAGHNLYYFDHNAKPGRVDRVKYTSSIIYRLDAGNCLTVLKNKLAVNSIAALGISPTLYAQMEAASCYAMYDFNRGTERLVFFWAR